MKTIQTDSLANSYYQELWQQLRRATADKKHAFRYFTLASLNQNERVRQRVVALRKIDEQKRIWIYTDYRSQKVEDFKANPKASLLFFNPKKWLQIRVEAQAVCHYQDSESKQIWLSLPEHSKKDYNTTNTPGSPIENPEDENHSEEKSFFCRISFEPKQIELLKIRREGHHRLIFTLPEKESEQIGVQWITP